MSKQNGHIDKLFGDAVTEYNKQPPDEVWSRIQNTMEAKKRSKRILLYRRLAVAAMLLLLVSIGYFLLIEKSANQSSNHDSIAHQEQIHIDKGTDVDKGIKQQITEQKHTGKQTTAKITKEVNPENEIENEHQKVKEHEGIKSGDQKFETYHSRTNITKLESKSLIALYNKPNYSIGEKYRTSNVLALGDYEQSIDPDQSNTGHWSIAANFSPAYSYRNLKQANGFPQNQYVQPASFYNNVEQAIMGYAGGLNMEYTHGSHWKFSIGLSYSLSGHQSDNLTAYYNPLESSNEFTTSTSLGPVKVNANAIASKVPSLSKPDLENSNDYMTYRVDGYLNNASIIHEFHYIEIPFIASYKFIDRKIDVSAMAGINAGLLINKSAYIRKDDIEARLENFNQIDSNIFNALMGLRLSYPLYRNFALSLQPTFKYAISPLAKLEGYKYIPYQYYLATGITYQL